MNTASPGWAALDDTVLQLLADGQQHDRRELLQRLAVIDDRHIFVSLADHVRAGRLVEIHGADATSYRITGAGLTHLRQSPSTLAKAA
jgi:predicted aconitase